MGKKILSFLALFTSFGTLICCALPALFVSLGFGAAFVGLLSAVPQLIWISEHKAGVFIVAGVLLVAAAALTRYSEQRSCPSEPELGAACSEARSIGRVMLYVSAGAYCIGGFFAYVAPLFG